MKAVALLFALFSVPALAYETTSIQVNLSRETIRDTKPLAVARTAKLLVRFDYDHCFVIGARKEFECKLTRTYDMYGAADYYAELEPAALRDLLTEELVWSHSEFQGDFFAILNQAVALEFHAHAPSRDVAPDSLVTQKRDVQTSDGKITFHLN